MQTPKLTRFRIRGFSLCLSVLLALASATKLPAQFTFVTNNSTITITGYTGPGGDVSIPPATNGYPVTSIGQNAFFKCYTLTSVTIPNGIINIGDSAFGVCTSLTNVVIPNTVTSIGRYAFQGCTNLTGFTIPDGVTSLSDGLFYGCTGLISVTIPNSVTTIGNEPFLACTSLTNVIIPNNVISIGDMAFGACFQLTSVTIPDSVTTIGIYAFELCTSLTNVTVPSSIVSMEMHVFDRCTNLTAAYFSGNAPSGDNTIFSGESGTVYYLPGATGWGQFFGGWPTALWLPQIQTHDNGFGVRTNRFGFNISWANGQTVVVEACTDLANPVWIPVTTNVLLSGTNYFTDPQWTNYPARFYRLRSP